MLPFKPAIGDVFAFGGTTGFFSNLIRLATWNPVTHVGICAGYDQDGPYLIESTTLYKNRSGVQRNPLHPRLEDYASQGRVWWLRLSPQARQIADMNRLTQFLHDHLGREYDYRQVVGVALNRLPFMDRLLNQADFNRLFCSELVAGAFHAAGITPPGWGISHITPEQICQYRLYVEAVQVVGKSKRIPGFCTKRVFHPEDPLNGHQTTL